MYVADCGKHLILLLIKLFGCWLVGVMRLAGEHLLAELLFLSEDFLYFSLELSQLTLVFFLNRYFLSLSYRL